MTLFRLSALALSAALSLPTAAQRPGGFQVLGPGGGGAMYHPTISPHDPQTVLVACDMGGSYITHDGGQSWRMFNLRGPIRSFAFDPADAKVIYAGGIGLWRSADSGATWKLVLPRASKVFGTTSSADEAEEGLLSNEAFALRDGSFSGVSAFTVDPTDSKHLVAALGNNLFSSKDAGEHWTMNEALPDRPTNLVLAPTGDGKSELWMSSLNGFWNLRRADHKLPSMDFTVPFGESNLQMMNGQLGLYVVSQSKLYRAVVNPADKSPTPAWKAMELPGPEAHITTFAASADGHTIYESYSKLLMDGKTWGGVAKSTDDGQHWTLTSKFPDSGEPAENFADGWITPVLDAWWGEEPIGLAVGPKDAQLVYATDLGRTMKSNDGGSHWAGVYSRDAGNGAWTSTGLDVLTCYGVHFDPFDAKRIFVDYTDVGLFRSEDGGSSWIASRDGAPRRWKANAYWTVFDPAVKGRMWSAMARTHDLPRSRMWRHYTATDFSGGITMSSDGGRHWQVSGTGLPDTAVTHLLLDEKSPVDHRILYAASFGHGVYKTTDGGASWQQKINGLPRGGQFSWRMAQASDGTLYLVIARQSTRPTIQNDEKDGSLFRSKDGAEHWERVALPEGVNGPVGLSVDPRDPAKLYMAAWARPEGKLGTGGGIYGSTDAGAHWHPLFTGDQHVYDVTYNPANPSELYATGFSSSAWRSIDDGAHWTRIPGFNFKAGHRVIADPVHPGHVYITTFGGGVWHGAVDGTPGVEDIASKEVAPPAK